MLSPEAERILSIFSKRGVRAGGMLDLCEVIGDLFPYTDEERDRASREAFEGLRREGYILEYNAAVELLEPGDRYLYQPHRQYSARVYVVSGRLMVRQMVLTGNPPEYTPDGSRECLVEAGDDKAIADAVRAAAVGGLAPYASATPGSVGTRT